MPYVWLFELEQGDNMPNITVTQEVVDALTEQGIDNIAAYLQNKADKHNKTKNIAAFNKLSDAKQKEAIEAVKDK